MDMILNLHGVQCMYRKLSVSNFHVHVSSFAEMFSWMTAFDITNYARWGFTFLTDMRQLQSSAPEVYAWFMNCDFVVNEAGHKFCQIPDDQGLEHFNKLGK